jgi:hypothetical protein
MRNMITIVEKIKALVPDDFTRKKELFAQLDDRSNSYLYTAPELMWLRWQEVGEILGMELGEPDSPWKQEIVDIFGNIMTNPTKLQAEIDNKLDAILMKVTQGGITWAVKLNAGEEETGDKATYEATEEAKQALLALFEQMAEEVIATSKDIIYTDGLPNLLETDTYVETREELRKEQRKVLAALLGKGE